MNGHSITTYDSPRINGWNESDFLIDPGTYVFYNATMTKNHEPYRSLPGEYSTDVVAAAAVGFLDNAIAATAERPFFLGVAPIAPHSETVIGSGAPYLLPPVPAKRHEGLFANVTVPRTPGFNPNESGSASYFKTFRQLNLSEIEYNDDWYRKRLQSLQAVDDLIDGIFKRLEASPEVMKNTYLIYTTDNGFHIGQHRLPPGKSCGIEEDINIPFFIRGPDVPENTTQIIPSSHTDIAPTLFVLGGIPLRDDFDGKPIPVTRDLLAKSEKSEHINIEFWGDYYVEGNVFYGHDRIVNNTYKTVRVVSEAYDLSYTVWCTNDHELYDIKNDQYQVQNLLSPSSNFKKSVNGWSVSRLTTRLDALLLTLKRCKGTVCTRPWAKLHREGHVQSLEDAMHSRYDRFYAKEQMKVTFSECAKGQVLSVEGALEPVEWKEE